MPTPIPSPDPCVRRLAVLQERITALEAERERLLIGRTRLVALLWRWAAARDISATAFNRRIARLLGERS